MKKQRALLLIMLLCSLGSMLSDAKTPISGVYGVNLGDSESVVSSKISGTWKTNSEGQRYYSSKNLQLGDCSFDQATFMFKNGKLAIVNIYSFAIGEDWGEYFNPAAYNFAKSQGANFRKKFDKMKSNLLQKYGQPDSETDDECIWQSSGNQIRLRYTFTDEINRNNNPECYCQVLVQYRVDGGSSSVNY